ncbi:MAG TPA: Rne/Rng family ribonuclease [Candidatus Gastranaerophilaceae bacterium]|nr:Rne/Rng family ribonuclease [Candidatus Gastranaerophilaceae bacterium]HPT41197.1 Rne/Rng family ribonuclease [Candidatus Gastranaerophilaceae bacterium]
MENKRKKIIIAERDNIAVVMEGKKIMEFFVHRGDVLLGDIYLAKVDNILPSIDAAFVDVGGDKMGFLHAEDVMGKGSLREKLSPKQKLVVQVVKEPTGHKGPRVTTEVSLPGRFLVLIPNDTGVNVSKKIESSKERARLKALVSLLKPVGVGIIIRTEAEGQSEADIQEDLEVLLEKWNNIVTSADTLTPPNLLYRDQDLLYRVIREACTEDISEIVVDTSFAMNRVKHLLQNWHMNKNIQVTLYRGKDPLLTTMDIHKEIKASLQPKVNLPSGGYLYVQTTEALTVIDVNSGKFISSSSQDETILKTNKEAIKEIARQLKLRNIGGMIIIDFIDMTSRVDKLAILEELELALAPDKAKPQIGQLSDLGLVELTRHRQGQSLAELFAKKCPHCQGNGYIMEELHFCAPIIESEFTQNQPQPKRRKQQGNFKKQFDRNQNNDQNQPQEEILPKESLVEQQAKEETPQKEEKRFNKNKNHRFNKNKKKDYRQPETTSIQENTSGHETHLQEVIKEVIQEVISPKPSKQKTKKTVEEKPVKSIKKRVPKKIQKQEVKHEEQVMA